MKRYYSEGGRSNPEFRYKVKVVDATDEMFNWCSTYTSTGHFDRWYVQWINVGAPGGAGAIFQFENEKPAILFGLKFGDK